MGVPLQVLERDGDAGDATSTFLRDGEYHTHSLERDGGGGAGGATSTFLTDVGVPPSLS